MNKKINCFGILCHPANETAPRLVPTILDWAKTNNANVYLEQSIAKKLGRPKLGTTIETMAEKVEMIIVLGGDGSILQAVRCFAKRKIPIAGINLGRLGFLTFGKASDTLKILDKLHEGKYHIEDRLMLKGKVKRGRKWIFEAIAMNDIVIVKAPISRVIDVEVSISGTRITSFRGDGIIFSTPTGSTGYSLSAGGPIIPPWINSIVLCPLASHTLNARAVVTSEREIFSARLLCTHSEVELVIDGQEGFKLQNNDIIEVSCASEVGRIVVQRPRNFFQILRKKMKWGR